MDTPTNPPGPRATVSHPPGRVALNSPDDFDPLAPSKAGLEPGDLIYYRHRDTGQVDHVAVYVGQVTDNNGNPVDIVNQHSVTPEACNYHAPWTPNPTGQYVGGQASVEFVKVNY